MHEVTHQIRSIKSFVKREGRLAPRIQRVWDELSNQFVLENIDALDDPQKIWGERKECELVVEIGSGQGNQIVHAALENPQRNYLALEVYHTGVAHTLLLIRNANLTGANLQNVRLLEVDATDLFRTGKLKGQISELWTFFPDPWPKRRHNKRRLINEQFSKLALEQLLPNGRWRLATDWEHYALQIQKVLGVQPSERFAGRLLTNFESKGLSAGRTIYDFEVTQQG
jgi:tRNA (guanine-N7-)-methyltransferase